MRQHSRFRNEAREDFKDSGDSTQCRSSAMHSAVRSALGDCAHARRSTPALMVVGGKKGPLRLAPRAGKITVGKIVDFHDFPMVLGKSGCRSRPPPKICSGLVGTTNVEGTHSLRSGDLVFPLVRGSSRFSQFHLDGHFVRVIARVQATRRRAARSALRASTRCCEGGLLRSAPGACSAQRFP